MGPTADDDKSGAVEISLEDLHYWNNDGQPWVCAAKYHGPFCRLCQPLDEVLAVCFDNVRLGLFKLLVTPDGDFRLQMTPKGEAHAESLIETDFEMAALWASLRKMKNNNE